MFVTEFIEEFYCYCYMYLEMISSHNVLVFIQRKSIIDQNIKYFGYLQPWPNVKERSRSSS